MGELTLPNVGQFQLVSGMEGFFFFFSIFSNFFLVFLFVIDSCQMSGPWLVQERISNGLEQMSVDLLSTTKRIRAR